MKKEPKLVAFVIEPIDGKWSIVNQTEYYSDGTWVCGLNLITSIEDVVERANELKINIIPISCLRKEVKDKNGKKEKERWKKLVMIIEKITLDCYLNSISQNEARDKILALFAKRGKEIS